MNLTIKAGQVVALVGHSGCGKSSTVALLERFYDPTEGEIKVDGHNIKDLNLSWWRRQVGLVGQEPVLFSGTIAGNFFTGEGKLIFE
jgi:ABC-type multidrug transport system fused ATPase/permease subunit